MQEQTGLASWSCLWPSQVGTAVPILQRRHGSRKIVLVKIPTYWRKQGRVRPSRLRDVEVVLCQQPCPAASTQHEWTYVWPRKERNGKWHV